MCKPESPQYPWLEFRLLSFSSNSFPCGIESTDLLVTPVPTFMQTVFCMMYNQCDPGFRALPYLFSHNLKLVRLCVCVSLKRSAGTLTTMNQLYLSFKPLQPLPLRLSKQNPFSAVHIICCTGSGGFLPVPALSGLFFVCCCFSTGAKVNPRFHTCAEA